MSLTPLEPLQFNFAEVWRSQIKPLFKSQLIAAALSRLGTQYIEFGELKYENEDPDDPDLHDQLELDRWTAIVKVKDLDWLREIFESEDLSYLSEAIAETLYPNETWEVIESDILTVVTNGNRSIVFDIKNFDRLSARASLYLAGDPDSESGAVEAESFLEERANALAEVLAKARAVVTQGKKKAEIIPLR